MSYSNNRPKIPADVRREVRKRCGFGCVICGFPIYEYEHFEEWHIVERHDPSEMTLLCNKHHSLKTRKFISKEKIIEANTNPFNIRNGISSPFNVDFYGREINIQMGNVMTSNFNEGEGAILIPLIVDSVPNIVVKLENNQIFFSFKLHDRHGNIVLNIEENEILFKTNLWDIEVVKNRIIFREATRKILLEIELSPPNLVKIKRGVLFCNKKVLEISENKGIYFKEADISISNLTAFGSLILQIGENNTGITPMFSYKY